MIPITSSKTSKSEGKWLAFVLYPSTSCTCSLTCCFPQDFLGSHSSYASVPWLKAYSIGRGVSTRVAAAGILQALTAVTFFEEAYQVKKGDIILIHTVAGGLGLLMAQLASHVGATVIGTTSTKEKAELAKAHGVDHVILYPVEDTVARVLEITNGEGVHAVFDGVGKDTYVFTLLHWLTLQTHVVRSFTVLIATSRCLDVKELWFQSGTRLVLCLRFHRSS